jgi:hypothetical protein
MKTPKHSLCKIVRFLNNTGEDAGFWLPNIQRPLLVWKTKAQVRHRKFIDN